MENLSFLRFSPNLPPNNNYIFTHGLKSGVVFWSSENQISNIGIMSPQGDDIKSWAFGRCLGHERGEGLVLF